MAPVWRSLLPDAHCLFSVRHITCLEKLGKPVWTLISGANTTCKCYFPGHFFPIGTETLGEVNVFINSFIYSFSYVFIHLFLDPSSINYYSLSTCSVPVLSWVWRRSQQGLCFRGTQSQEGRVWTGITKARTWVMIWDVFSSPWTSVSHLWNETVGPIILHSLLSNLRNNSTIERT